MKTKFQFIIFGDVISPRNCHCATSYNFTLLTGHAAQQYIQITVAFTLQLLLRERASTRRYKFIVFFAGDGRSVLCGPHRSLSGRGENLDVKMKVLNETSQSMSVRNNEENSSILCWSGKVSSVTVCYVPIICFMFFNISFWVCFSLLYVLLSILCFILLYCFVYSTSPFLRGYDFCQRRPLLL